MILEEIPLINGFADQRLDVTIDNQPFTLRVMWNERFGYWSLSIYERDGDLIIAGIKMVARYPLVQRFQKFTFAGDLYFLSRSGLDSRPTFDDLQTNFALIYYDAETPPSYPLPITPRR